MGKELKKWKDQNIKVPIVILEDVMRPVGQNCQMLITEEGCIVRGYAPLNVKKWGDINKDEKERLIGRLRV